MSFDAWAVRVTVDLQLNFCFTWIAQQRECCLGNLDDSCIVELSGSAIVWPSQFVVLGRLIASVRKVATWLILPVVICLSQRLSHACLSINCLYCETANGSLNQL